MWCNDVKWHSDIFNVRAQWRTCVQWRWSKRWNQCNAVFIQYCIALSLQCTLCITFRIIQGRIMWCRSSVFVRHCALSEGEAEDRISEVVSSLVPTSLLLLPACLASSLSTFSSRVNHRGKRKQRTNRNKQTHRSNRWTLGHPMMVWFW